mgnify:CR=1 FL=1
MDDATLLALAAAFGILCLGFLLMGGEESSAEKRVRSLGLDGRAEKGGMLSFMKKEDDNSRRKQIEDSLTEIEKRQKSKKKQNKSLKARLIQADWKIDAKVFMMVCGALVCVTGFITYLIKPTPLFIVLASLGVGLGIPMKVLQFSISRRQKKFTESFADAMDIIVRGVRTGLPLGDCLKIIAHEAPEPVRGEFVKVVEGESVGVPIDVCLERMYERMPISEVNFFATVLNIQKTTGGNLGEALGNLSKVLRGRKLLREKIKALSAEAKTSAMIIGFLPIGVGAAITFVAPDYMTELYTTSTGHRNLMIAAVLMMVGTGIMRKMINFKF